MELGFETFGNATLLVHDQGPLLVTDPWLGGSAYFGSWTLSHEIGAEQLEAALAARYVWFSHGHPDHLNGQWLSQFTSRLVLLPDHIGGRIERDLVGAGLTVRVLPHAKWVDLTERVRIWCFADVNQDAVLLVDIDGCLVVNVNDATQTGWGPAIRREIRRFRMSVLLQLSGFGDADMINFVDDGGRRLTPLPQRRRERGYRVGDALAKTAEGLGVTHVVPFSSMHRYQRSDTEWANAFTVRPTDYGDGFASKSVELLPPFVQYDRLRDDWKSLEPAESRYEVHAPEEFGDDWSHELGVDEAEEVEAYLRRIEYLDSVMGFVGFNVGGREHIVRFKGPSVDVGVMFRVPRASLLAAVRFQVFDDLLIGNFMETTLVGSWPANGLAARFGKHVTRFADNGGAYSDQDVDRYLEAYRSRLDALDRVRVALEGGGARLVRSVFEVDSPPYRAARRAYWGFKRLTRP